MWPSEAQAAYVACAIDTDGWVSLRETRRRTPGDFRLTPNVGVTNQSVELIHRVADFSGVARNISRNGVKGAADGRKIVTVQDIWQGYWRSPLHVIPILELAIPYLLAKRQRAQWVLEFAKSRISPAGKVYRSGRPYTERDWELMRWVRDANGKSARIGESAI